MTRKLTILVVLVVLAVGCGGGGGLVERGSTRAPESQWGGRLAVDVRFAEGAPAMRVTAPGEVSLAVTPVTRRLVIDLFELGDDDRVVATTFVDLDFSGGDQYVLIQPIPAGTHLLRILGLDSAGEVVSGFQSEVTIRPQEVTDVVAYLTPQSGPSPIVDLRHLFAANRADDTLTTVRGDGLGGFEALPGPLAVAGDAPGDLAPDPDFKVLFVVCGNPSSLAGKSTLESFRLNRLTGALTPVSSVVLADGDRPESVAVGRSRVYVGRRGPGLVSGYDFDPDTGVVSGSAATTAAAPDVVDLALDEQGRLLVAASPSGLRVLAVDGNGDLGALLSSVGASGGVPSHLFLTPGFVFTGAGDRVLVHDLDSNGILTNARSAALPGAAGLALHPTGRYLYVAATGVLGTFDVDRDTGNLGNLRSVSTVAGTPSAVVADPDEKHVVVTVSRGSGTAGVLQAFAIDPDLGTPAAQTSLGVGAEPLGLVLVER